MYPKLWEATGIPFRELIDRLITLALEVHGEKKARTKYQIELPEGRWRGTGRADRGCLTLEASVVAFKTVIPEPAEAGDGICFVRWTVCSLKMQFARMIAAAEGAQPTDHVTT